MKKFVVFVLSFVLAAVSARAGDVRRISLDGKDGVASPEREAGKDGIDRIHKVETPQLELFPAQAGHWQ